MGEAEAVVDLTALTAEEASSIGTALDELAKAIGGGKVSQKVFEKAQESLVMGAIALASHRRIERARRGF